MKRSTFLAALVALAARLLAQIATPDDSWDRQFRKVLREFNLFILEYNEGVRNQKQWSKVVAEFEKLKGTK